MEMKNYLIDLTGTEGQAEIQDRIAAGLALPENYGRNLDALFDVLTSLPLPCRIRFTGIGNSMEEAGQTYLGAMKRLCADAVKETPGLEILWEEESAGGEAGKEQTAPDEPKKVRPKAIDPSNSPFYRQCYVCGPDNKAGLHLKNRYIDGKSHMEFTPDENMIGLVTRKSSLMHGGFTSMLFDEVMTYVLMGQGFETVTLNMSIDYVSPAWTGHHMTAEGWIERREGKKIWTAAEIIDDETGETVAKATGLYYRVNLSEFIDGIDR